ncbi:S-methyl-5-thioribose-1-phosphate isomerase [Gaertneriomyces sp. JEL0708]|nr:S-methyl-5-thioribose-1-phosphate isomerase [Gaertneriomyces sp. JEL0708]
MVSEEAARTLQAIRYDSGSLEVLDQLLLPFESVYEPVRNAHEGHEVIKSMKVRGAPAIAIVAALSLAAEMHSFLKGGAPGTAADVRALIHSKLEYLKTSRPTAVNLFEAAARLDALAESAANRPEATSGTVAKEYIAAAEYMLQQDVADNRSIGQFGAEFVMANKPTSHDTVQILTHCNTGSLATAGWGTALGIIRDLHQRGSLSHAYCTETRPYNQGSRLTAYELVYENIPATLVCDNMASALLSKKPVTAIIVGADRVAANGDTANKIGTYQLAITAKHHGIMFLVAAPSTSIDLDTVSGDHIIIEERAASEVVQIRGKPIAAVSETGKNDSSIIHIAAPGINVWNPAFDITPAALITGIVTEKGVCVKAPGQGTFDLRTFLANI